MNQTPVDISIFIPSYEIGKNKAPKSMSEAWERVEPEIRGDLHLVTWEDSHLYELQFVPPNNLVCPDTEEGVARILEEVRELKKTIFAQLGIETREDMQLLFVIYHEYKHSQQNRDKRLKPYQSDNEIRLLENEADEYAQGKLTERFIKLGSS